MSAGRRIMPQPPDTLTADELPPKPLRGARAHARRKGWRLVGDAPAHDIPHARDRRGAQRGMIIVLVAGGLFWAGVAALVLFLRG
jgi:hypothetical protein